MRLRSLLSACAVSLGSAQAQDFRAHAHNTGHHLDDEKEEETSSRNSSRRVLRRRRPPRSPTPPSLSPVTPTDTTNDSRQDAFVLNLGSFNPSSQDVVSIFDESLRELAVSSESQLSLPRSPTVAAEFDQDQDRYTILCVSILGDADLYGLKVIEDPRTQRHLLSKESDEKSIHPISQRELRRRRRNEPYYLGKPDRRTRQPFSADNLLALINAKSSGFQVDSLFGTDSSICGNLVSLAPASPTNVPSVAPSRSPIVLSPAAPSISDSSAPSISQILNPSAIPNVMDSEMPSVSIEPTTVLSSAAPSISDSSAPSISQSLNPSAIPSVMDSEMPSVSFEPTLPLPTASMHPSVSISPTLPPPDWEQFGNTILGVTKQKIVFAEGGTILGTVFNTCFDGKPCGQLYQNTNTGNWIAYGQAVPALSSESQVIDISLSGDGSRVAFVSVDTMADDSNLQTRRAQVFDIASNNFQAVGGNTIIDLAEFSASSKTNLCISSDGSLVTMSMGSLGVNLVQAWTIQSATWAKLGDVLNTTYANAAVEYSADCRTVAFVDSSTRSPIYKLATNAVAWTSQDTGFPETVFASLSFDGSGTKVAVRAFSLAGSIEIYEYSQSAWQQTGSIARGQVFESNFGYKLDLNSDGNTVAIATFRDEGSQTITCAQAFQYNTTDWEPLGRPPCLGAGHAGFGAIIALSGDGLTMAVGDIGNFNDFADSGHIHTYKFLESG